jgi:hypothetical protein
MPWAAAGSSDSIVVRATRHVPMREETEWMGPVQFFLKQEQSSFAQKQSSQGGFFLKKSRPGLHPMRRSRPHQASIIELR